MNKYTHFKKKVNIYIRTACILASVIYSLVCLRSVFAHKFTYSFERNENSEIHFFQEKEVFEKETSSSYGLNILFDVDTKIMNKNAQVFTYEEENFISFGLLNNILLSYRSKNGYKNGIIESDFDLSYFLRLTKYIAEFPVELNNYQFICMLTVLKCFKVVENKMFNEFINALIFSDLIFLNENQTNIDALNCKEISYLDIFMEIDVSFIKTIISAFFKTFMIKYVFDDGNLILLENVDKCYDNSLFDKHIPYKNLLINNCKIFCSLENILKNIRCRNIFQLLLNRIGIKSLILSNFQESRILNMSFYFYIFRLSIFKSIIISNFKTSSTYFLDRLFIVLNKNIDYLSLKNTTVNKDGLVSYLNRTSLRGLVLHGSSSFEEPDQIEGYLNINKTLGYLDLRIIKLYFNWWLNFIEKKIVQKLIFTFFTSNAQANFIKEFCKGRSYTNILHLEICFFNEIFSGFYNSLSYFKSLRTLIILRCKTDNCTEISLIEAINSMDELENIEILHFGFSEKFYNFLFEKRGIQTIDLKNFTYGHNSLHFNSFKTYVSITKINLNNVKITLNSLLEICKCNTLTKLNLDVCNVEPTIHCRHLYFILRNIVSLHLERTNLEIIKNVNFLAQLDHIENLYVSKCGFPPGYLAKLSFSCNSTLKILSYKFNILDINDLDRIRKMKVLRELNLSSCKFHESSFYNLGNNTKFLACLNKLNLRSVKIDLKDLKFITEFKALKQLTISYNSVGLYMKKYCIFSEKLYRIARKNIIQISNRYKLHNYLQEEAVDGIYFYNGN